MVEVVYVLKGVYGIERKKIMEKFICLQQSKRL